MKGIILAGGSGARLHPLTKSISKQLMPIYDKPMIYYPLSVLMQSGISDILIISTIEDLPRFEKLLGNGNNLGLKLDYLAQPSPDGLAQAFIIGKDFVQNEDVCLILGDNIFYGYGLNELLLTAINKTKNENNATIFGYHVSDPERYGVIDFDNNGKVLSIEEKPINPKSNFAVTGIYFYPNDVLKKASKVRPSARNELEITSVNEMYLAEDRLNVVLMGKGYAWLDTGTHESLLEASSYIETIEKRQGLKVACIEEIAFEKGFIDKNQLLELAQPLAKNQYGQYLLKYIEKLS